MNNNLPTDPLNNNDNNSVTPPTSTDPFASVPLANVPPVDPATNQDQTVIPTPPISTAVSTNADSTANSASPILESGNLDMANANNTPSSLGELSGNISNAQLPIGQTTLSDLPLTPVPIVNQSADPLVAMTSPVITEIQNAPLSAPTMNDPLAVSSQIPVAISPEKGALVTNVPLENSTTSPLTPPLVNEFTAVSAVTPTLNQPPAINPTVNESTNAISAMYANNPVNSSPNPLPLLEPLQSASVIQPISLEQSTQTRIDSVISDQPIASSVTSTQPIITESGGTTSSNSSGGGLPPLSPNMKAQDKNSEANKSSTANTRRSVGSRFFRFILKIVLFLFFIVIVLAGIIGYLQVTYPTDEVLQKVTTGDLGGLIKVVNKAVQEIISGKQSDSKGENTPVSYANTATTDKIVLITEKMINQVITTITQGTYSIESTGQVIMELSVIPNSPTSSADPFAPNATTTPISTVNNLKKATATGQSFTNVDQIVTYLQQGKTKAFVFTKQGINLLRNAEEEVLLVSNSTKQYSVLQTPQLTNILLPLFDEGYPLLGLVKSLQDDPQKVKKAGENLWETSFIIDQASQGATSLVVQFMVDPKMGYIMSMDFINMADSNKSLGVLKFNFNAINTITLDKITTVPEDYVKVEDTKLYTF